MSANVLSQQQADRNEESLQWITRGVIGLAVTAMLAWAGWLSMTAIQNTLTITQTSERQTNQFHQLRDDIAEIKQLLLRRID